MCKVPFHKGSCFERHHTFSNQKHSFTILINVQSIAPGHVSYTKFTPNKSIRVQDRLHTYITLWCICISIVAMETQQYAHFLIVAGIDVAVNNMCRLLPWKCNNGFHLHCCQATKYFIICIKYYE